MRLDVLLAAAANHLTDLVTEFSKVDLKPLASEDDSLEKSGTTKGGGVI